VASISACVMTCGPGARVAALLALLRPAADELFVAVDERAQPDVVAAVAPHADRLVRYAYAEPVDRPLPWLHAECRGDWVLTVDDDEIPSAGLLAELRALVAAPDVTHYWLPRRWLWPDATSYLAESPWRPDYQARLVANDARLLRFPNETHRPIEVLGPGRYLEHGLYHADCIVNALERRKAKAAKYERLRPGKRLAGRPLNHAFYLPEQRPDARTAPVAPEDAALIARVLEAADAAERAHVAPPAVPAATREEIDRHWWGRTLGEGAYRARLTLVAADETLTVGEQRTVDVRVENLGDTTWPWGKDAEPEIRLAYRWYGADGGAVVRDGLRTPFPADVPPGASALVPVHVVAPALAGPFRLVVDLVHEHVRWFECGVESEVRVVPAERVAVLGDPRLVVQTIERLLESAAPVEPVILDPDPASAGALDGYRRAPLLRGRGGARRLVAELSACDRLLVVGDSGWPRRQRAAILTARGLGLRVETHGG
jgi:hypothetical protein